MIRVGLAGWGDHDRLYPSGTRPQDKLRTYGRKLSVVEVDSAFYAIQPPERYAVWSRETPAHFQFIVKAFQVLTGHSRGNSADSGGSGRLEPVYEAFRASLQPALDAGKLRAVLFQYPPWFDCTRGNVAALREAKAMMAGIPCALEFRHQSWFTPEYRARTLAFMEREGWIHSVCDEPQAGEKSVPIVLQATHPDLSIVRMHGRNAAGWNAGGTSDWRAVRYLYHYSESELAEWAAHLERLHGESKDVIVIFNNNSGGHAAGNAADLIRLLGKEPLELAAQEPPPEQLDLFQSP